MATDQAFANIAFIRCRLAKLGQTNCKVCFETGEISSYLIEYPMAIQTQRLRSQGESTQLNVYFKLKTPLPRWLTLTLARSMFRMFTMEEQFKQMARLIVEETTQSEWTG
jgi:hypothetical protein